MSDTAERQHMEVRPDPEWVRGTCPKCGKEVVSNVWYVGGRGYIVIWDCWGGLNGSGCTYRRVL